MGRKKLPSYENVTIEDIAAEGKSLTRIDDVVVFVQGAVPGDVVDIQVIRKRKNYREARITRYKKYSPVRSEPFCSHFGLCGGCKWQHLPYSEQLKYKEKQVREALLRIGKTEPTSMDPILGAEKTEFYRNKLEYTFSNHRWLTEEETSSDQNIENRNGLGFHVPGRFDRIVHIEKCHLQADPSNKIRDAAAEFAFNNDLTFYDHKTNEGLLRNLIIRTSRTGEIMVILSVQFDEELIYKMMDHIFSVSPDITSLMYVINPKKNETLWDQDILVWKGRDHIFDTIGDLKFKIGPKSFFQTNTLQAERLYDIALEFANLTGNELVYDLYTGTGTIANYIASRSGKVIGIESVPEAIEDARVNSELNNIENTEFHVGDMKEVFTSEFISKHGRPEVLITDPPRAGMHEKVVKEILDLMPDRIVYVSCNPATQARDLTILSEKYEATRCRPVDMFPHTHHIENVLLLELKH